MHCRRSAVMAVALTMLVAGSTTAAALPAGSHCPPKCEVVLTPTTYVDPSAQTPAVVAGGTVVVFLGPTAAGGSNGLWSVPVDGSEPPSLLAGGTPGTAGVVGFLAPDVAGRVVFLAEATPGVFELASVGAGEPASRIRLDPGLPDHTVDAFGGPHGGALALTSAGQVVFRLIPLREAPSSLWTAPIDGSRRPVRLSPGLHAWDFVVAPDGSSVVFRADDRAGRRGLYSADLSAGGGIVRLTLPGAGGVDLASHLPVYSADGGWVAYLSNPEETGRLDLMAAEVGHLDSQRLIAPGRAPGEGGISLFRPASTDADLVFTNDPASPGVTQLFSSPFDAHTSPTLLSSTAPPMADSGAVWYFEVVGNDRVVYYGNLDALNRLEMYSAAIGAAASQITLSTVELPPDADAWVGLPTPSPDGARVAYLGLLTGDAPELYSAPIDQPGAQVRLSDAGDDGVAVDYFLFTPDGSRLVYTGMPVTGGTGTLHSVPADGSGTPTELTGAVVSGGGVRFGLPGIRMTPDGSWVVFVGDIDIDGVQELFAVPVDGSADPVKLSKKTAKVGATASIIDTSRCRVVFTHNRARLRWLQISIATIPGCER